MAPVHGVRFVRTARDQQYLPLFRHVSRVEVWRDFAGAVLPLELPRAPRARISDRRSDDCVWCDPLA